MISNAHLVTLLTLILSVIDIILVMGVNQRIYGSATEICSSTLFTMDVIGKNKLTAVIVFLLVKVRFRHVQFIKV